MPSSARPLPAEVSIYISVQIVQEALFSNYPPAPPTEEEIQLEASQKAAAAAKLVRRPVFTSPIDAA